MISPRLAVVVLPALLLVLPPHAEAAPVDKPAPKAGARAASSPVAGRAALPASARAAAPVAVEVDPMERLRLRLTERLAAPGAAPVSGTLDLQVGTRAASPASARAPAKGADTPAGAALAPTAQDIARGHAEGIAWSRAQGGAPTHRVSAHPAPPALATPSAPVAAAAHGMTARTAHSAPAAPVATAGARRSAGAAKGQAGGGGHGAHAHWAYEGAAGPAAWGALKPEFGLCANGQRQSPIDIRGGLAVELEPVKFDYRPSAFAVIDNGHTVQVNVPPGNAIEVGGRRFELVQFHFHRPSEERIDGRQFEMSLHLVHKDPTGRLAVVGVLLGKGPAHPAVQAVWNNLPLERDEEAPARALIDPGHLLPEDRRYYTYMGSLTTPPCSEGVLWVVMRTPVTVAAQQVELFARIYPMNARPVQSVAGRRIMQSE